MIYLIDAKIDYNRVGDKLSEILPEEWKTTAGMVEAGQLIGIWRKANAQGVVAIWNMPDHDAVAAQIRAMPLYPYFSDVTVTPLVAHPRYPEFCEPRPRA